MQKKEKIIKKRHVVLFVILRFFGSLYCRIFKHYKIKNKFDNKKENVLVLSNHQTDIDAVYLSLHFKRTLYFLMTDSVTSNKSLFKLLHYVFAPITKKKGTSDAACVKKMIEVKREGGSIAIFPEGNRTYAEFQYPITDAISKLIKILDMPVVIFNIHGGTGTSPRFKHKNRKGEFYGEIKKVIYPEEFKKMSDEELKETVVSNLRVYDSEAKTPYRSKRRAEYLEKMLFVCPKCNSVSTLTSKGKYIRCNSCSLEVEYTEDMHLKSNDESFKYTILNDWYQMQKSWVKEFNPTDDVIFKDGNVRIFSSNSNEKRKLLSKGNITLYKDKLVFDSISFDISLITIASVISGSNFYFSLKDGNTYLVKGKNRFNPLKYVLMFNRLDTDMKLNKKDIYYSLD